MPRRPSIVIAAIVSLACAAPSSAEDKAPKTTPVKIKDITLQIPDTWTQQEPSNKLRLAQFDLPKAEGDSVGSELVVSSFGGTGGGIDQNLPRWLNEFAPEGRTVKIWTGKSPQGDYMVAEIKGTHKGSSFAPRAKPLENARMISAILTVEEKGLYYFKVAGPEKSVAAQAEAIRKMLGGDIKAEKEYKPNQE